MRKFQKYILLFFFVALSMGLGYAIFFPPAAFEKDKAKEEFRKGLLLYNDYDYAASVDFFVQSLSYNPEFLLARRMLGQALYFSGQTEEALNEWQGIFDMGGYDPMLAVHMQNLRSPVTSPTASENLAFARLLSPQPGYRYQFPAYMGTLQDKTPYLVSSGGDQSGSLIFMNNSIENTAIYRRISGKLQTPLAAAASAKEVWISDYASDSLHRLKLPTLPFLTTLQNPSALGGKGSEPLKFYGPAGICYHNSSFYVADAGNNRVQKIDEDGNFLFQFSKVAGDFSLQNPFGLTCSAQGNIYVSEPDESRISVFDEDGNFLQFLGDHFLKKPRHLTFDENTTTLVIADEQQGVFLFNVQTQSLKKIEGYQENNTFYPFARAYSAMLDDFGNLYVVDYGGHHVVQFVPEQNLYSNLDVWIERVDVSSFPVVALWVSVADSQRAVLTSLRKENFLLSENDAMLGNPDMGYLKQFENQASSVVVLDRNKKMLQYKDTYSWLFDFIYGGIRQKDVMKVVSYNSESHRDDSPWTNSRLRLRQAYENTQENDYQTTQNLQSDKALYYAVAELLPQHGTRSVLWITDGSAEDSSFTSISLQRIENFARANHIAIYVLSYENPDVTFFEANKNRLQTFAQNTGGKYFSVYRDNLQTLDTLIRKTHKQRYVLIYRSGADSDWKNQYMDVKVMVNFMNRKGSESGGYFIPANGGQRGGIADIFSN